MESRLSGRRGHYLQLFVNLCRSRLRMSLISVLILAGFAVAFGLMYLRLRDVIGERIEVGLTSINIEPNSAAPLLFQLARDVHSVVMGELWFIGRLSLLSAAILFWGSDVCLLGLSFLIEGIILPRSDWTLEYLWNRDAYERAALRPLVLIIAALFGGLALWAYNNVADGVSDEYLRSIFPNLIVVLAAVVFTVDYVLQVKWGFLRYLKVKAPELSKLFRVLLARFLFTAALCAFAFVGLEAVERYLIPRVIQQMEASEAAQQARTQRFIVEASMRGVDADTVGKVTETLDQIKEKTTAFYRSLPEKVHAVIDSAWPTIGLIVFFAFLTTVYFPLVYMEVRFAGVAVGIVVISLIGVDVIVRWVMPKAFKVLHGPTAVVATVGLIVVLGETIVYFVMRVFQRYVKCWHCHRPNPPGGRFCKVCGAPLAGAEISAPAYVGVERTKHLHKADCVYLAGIAARRLVGFEQVGQAFEEGYKPCGHCLKEVRQAVASAE